MKPTTVTAVLKQMNYPGKPQPLTDVEKQAGIVAKLFKNMKTHEGYWLCLVKVADLHSDLYQRTLDLKHAREIAADENFKARLARYPLCSMRRDSPLKQYHGKPTIFKDDGQHIIEVLMMRDAVYLIGTDKVIPCLVHFDMTFEQAADTFYHNNNGMSRKKVANWIAFNAAYLGGSDHHKIVMDTAACYGLTTPIDRDFDKTRGADLTHADRYIRILKSRGLDFLDRLFALHANCWKGQKHNVTFIKAMEQMMNTFNIGPTPDIINALRSPTLIEDLYGEALTYAKHCSCGVNEPAWKHAIYERLYKSKTVPAVVTSKPSMRKAA